MYTLMMTIVLLSGEVNKVAQQSYKTLEACSAVAPFFNQAANRYFWNNEQYQTELVSVSMSCVKTTEVKTI